MNDPIISLRKAGYRYPHAHDSGASAPPPALAGIDLDIGAGEFVAVVGANGSGKSTLARLLNGLILPGAGKVAIDGMRTDDRTSIDAIRETVGMVFQNPESQIVATSVADDIAFGMENLGWPAEEIELRVRQVAARFGIGELLSREPHWLSGGQKQRTVLAGVVALRPRVLVLDEPTSMLDPRSQGELLELVRELWREGTTVIYITHIMEEVTGAPRVVALSGGTVAFDGTPRELFSNPQLIAAAGLIPPLPVRLAASLAGRGHAIPVPLTIPELVENICALS